MATPYDSVKIKMRRSISFVWIIPIATVIVGIYLFIQYQLDIGPKITLVFNRAEDITVDKTEIRTMNIKIGTIKKMELSDDYQKIIATAQMDSQARKMIREDTLFWVVKPRIDKEGISGLSTLLSGPYIQMQPGITDKKADKFNVLESPPVAGAGAKCLRVTLIHSDLGKFDVGDPIYFKGFVVGRIEKISLNLKKQYVEYQLFIGEPYNTLIYDNTNFWIKKAIDIKISERGVNIQLGSLENLFLGGITFDIPANEVPGKAIKTDFHKFNLYDSQQKIKEDIFESYTKVVMFFDESIRGLTDAATVEYRGIRVGSVIKAPIESESSLEWPEKAIPILVSIKLGKEYTNYTQMADLFSQGLRASVHPGNILTGQMFIDLSFHPDDKSFTPQRFKGYPVFPTRPGSFTQMQNEIAKAFNTIKKIPFDKSIMALNKALESTTKFMNTGQRALHELESIVGTNESKQLAKSINLALNSIYKTLDRFDRNSPEYHSLQQALIHLDDVLIQLRPLLEQLNKKPNALIFKGAKPSDPIPKGHQ